MATAAALQRLRKEYKRILIEPVEHIDCAPCEDNILEWHYVIKGPNNSPYNGGIYHGKLLFPKEYPYKPPSIMILTPNGRFKTNTRLCLSMSDFHPETWNPLWSVSSILSGLLSFMLENTPTYGSMDSTEEFKHLCASKSLQFNCKDKIFQTLFPQYIEQFNKLLAENNIINENAQNNNTENNNNNINTINGPILNINNKPNKIGNTNTQSETQTE
ncbi:unnamed protein product, partial [Adineta steineri]